MSNIREVSRVAGVSTATVSRALKNPELVSKSSLEKVMAAVEALKYRPNMLARNFRSERSYSLVILVPSIDNPFYSRVIRGAEFAAQERGYSVLLGDIRDSLQREREYVKLVETRLSDGIIQFRPSQERSTVEEEPTFPMVYACGCERTPLPSVRIDNVDAAKTVVDYLIAQGHKRIAVLCGTEANPHTVDRLKGYKKSLAAAGIKYRPGLVVSGGFTMASGAEAGAKIAKMSNRPSAIFCMNDEMAIGAIQGLKSAGIDVPRDVSIAGFDDIEFSKHCDPPITTIKQPSEEMGKIACDMLVDMIEGREVDQEEVILPYEFVVRASTPDR